MEHSDAVRSEHSDADAALMIRYSTIAVRACCPTRGVDAKMRTRATSDLPARVHTTNRVEKLKVRNKQKYPNLQAVKQLGALIRMT